MGPRRLALPLAASLLLAGCTFFGGESTQEGADKSAYTGGPGFALAIVNDAKDPFYVVARVLGVGNAELGRLEEHLPPGGSIEKWWSLPGRSTYSARFNYTWTGAAGSTSQGFDDQVFNAQDCPAVSRLAWALKQDENVVGSAFLGKTCVLDGEPSP